jgi:hypothetical protein
MITKMANKTCRICTLPLVEDYHHYGCMGIVHDKCMQEYRSIRQAEEKEYRRLKNQARKEAKLADAGILITCCFSSDAFTQSAPPTGHYDDNFRPVPDELPKLPLGSVVNELFRSPFGLININIPDVQVAEIFWENATKVETAGYELVWIENGKELKNFTGPYFYKAEKTAARLEREAFFRSLHW